MRWLRYRWRRRRRRVVRVRLGAKFYSYRASRRCRLGELVVPAKTDPALPIAFADPRRVEGFGRRGYLGRLKRVRPVDKVDT
jgi:hypothetical protein